MANTVACLVMLTIVVQAHCFYDLTNTASTVGASVIMRCRTRYGNCSFVSWAVGTNFVKIYEYGDRVQGFYNSRYSLDATSGCHLQVWNVQLTDAGRYTCIDDRSYPTAKSAELIVVESEPKCHVSASAETTAEGDRVNLSCEVTFGGNSRVLMTWKDTKNVPLSTIVEKVRKTVSLLHTVTAERPVVPSYECVASFEVVTEGTAQVSNIKTVRCETQPIRILYGVKTAKLTPSQLVHCARSIVYCSSDGNPFSSFKWQESEMENGPWKDAVKGQIFSTNNDTSIYYRCVASNLVKNITFTVASSTFRVNSPAEAKAMKTRCSDELLNTVSAVGANVTMRCKTRSGNCSDVIWGIGTNAVSIYKSEVGFLGDYGSRYSVDPISGCHLIVKNVQLTDVGRLTCVDESSSTTISKSAELIVIESEPKCHVSASADTIVEGGMVDLRCEATFGGNREVFITWKDVGNVPPSNKTGKILTLSHSVSTERPVVPSYECVALFEIVREGTSLVPNIPTASCKTQPVKILYGVMTAELTPSQAVHSPGSIIICSSDGNPPPTFKWQESETENGRWKDVADVTGPELTTSNETSLFYRCVARNVVKNASYTTTSSSFRVISTAAETNAETKAETKAETTGIVFFSVFGIGFVVVLVLFVIFVVVLFILFRLKLLQIRRTQGNTPMGTSEVINDKGKKEHDTTTMMPEYDCLELKKERNTAVPSQSALPAKATYASLQNEGESHCYTSLAEEEKKQNQK